MGRDNADERSVALAHIDNRILLIRDRKVLLDADLAALYGVQTRVLNQAVKRNRERFPADFMFRLSAKEFSIWRSQSVIPIQRRRWLYDAHRSPLQSMGHLWPPQSSILL